MNDILAIKNYILFLKNECHLSISLHSFDSTLIIKRTLLAFNIHANPYCICIKRCKSAQNHCLENQQRVLQKCETGSFCGICYAGVKEYVYPITYNEKIIGFICVSGYSCDNAKEYMTAISEKYDLSYKELRKNYRSLKSEMPEKAYIDTLIYPLCHMLELAHIKANLNETATNSFIASVIAYIKKNYTEKLTSDDLCKIFNCSRSHLSHNFNMYTKMSITTYINTLRVESAKNLLTSTDLGIADISLAIGFDEPNYFSNIFKKFTAMTPTAYRKSKQQL